jgi:hypothetical protein
MEEQVLELRDFVRSTITELISAVKDAQVTAAEQGARINPHLSAWDLKEGKLGTFYMMDDGSIFTRIDFDIALTHTGSTQTKGGVGVALGVVGLGSSGQSASGKTALSRIQFSLGLVLPVQKKAAQP